MLRRRKSSLLLVLLFLFSLHATAADSTYVLTRDGFLSVVRAYHPIAKQAGLKVTLAQMDIRQARGAFDPVLKVNADQKTFDKKLYYNYFNPSINIPTWYGIDLKAALNDISGQRVNPEETIGKTSFVGISMSASGLLFDSRRATLRQAQSLAGMTRAERELIINDLIYDALSSYWNWVKEYQFYQLVKDVVRVNEERYKFIVIEFKQGSRPAIDTTEALAQLQSFYTELAAARVAFYNAGLELSNYMWLDNQQPFEWNAAILPDTAVFTITEQVPDVETLLADIAATHPKLKMLGFKQDVLELERKLKAQYLIPKLNVSGGLLSKNWDLPKEVSSTYAGNNYKLDIDFSLPLFMRSSRGAFRAAGVKIQDIQLQQELTVLQLENKVKSYHNEAIGVRQQLNTFEQAYINYQALYRGEKLKFETGESTIFLLNSRENKLIEAGRKLTELRAKFKKSYTSVFWAAGQLS